MQIDSEFLQRTFTGNSVTYYIWFAGILIAGLLFKKLFSMRFKKTAYRILKKYDMEDRMETFLRLPAKQVCESCLKDNSASGREIKAYFNGIISCAA